MTVKGLTHKFIHTGASPQCNAMHTVRRAVGKQRRAARRVLPCCDAPQRNGSAAANEFLQWRSQGLEVGWSQRVWGTEVPQRGPGAAYTICSGQTHFRDVFIEDIRCTVRLTRSLLPPRLLLQKTLRICANLTTHPGQGRVGTGGPPVPHCGYATEFLYSCPWSPSPADSCVVSPSTAASAPSSPSSVAADARPVCCWPSAGGVSCSPVETTSAVAAPSAVPLACGCGVSPTSVTFCSADDSSAGTYSVRMMHVAYTRLSTLCPRKNCRLPLDNVR